MSTAKEIVRNMNFSYTHLDMAFVWTPSATEKSLTGTPPATPATPKRSSTQKPKFTLTTFKPPSQANLCLHFLLPKTINQFGVSDYHTQNSIKNLTEAVVNPRLGELLPLWYPINQEITPLDMLNHEWKTHGAHCELSPSLYLDLAKELADEFLTSGERYCLMDIWKSKGILPGIPTSAKDLADSIRSALGNEVSVETFIEDNVLYLKHVRVRLDIKDLNLVNFSPNLANSPDPFILETMQQRICRDKGENYVA